MLDDGLAFALDNWIERIGIPMLATIFGLGSWLRESQPYYRKWPTSTQQAGMLRFDKIDTNYYWMLGNINTSRKCRGNDSGNMSTENSYDRNDVSNRSTSGRDHMTWVSRSIGRSSTSNSRGR